MILDISNVVKMNNHHNLKTVIIPQIIIVPAKSITVASLFRTGVIPAFILEEQFKNSLIN